MRVSTAQFYYQNSLQLSNKQSGVNDQIGYISSGKRVLTAKDDAVQFGTLTGYKDELANIEKYKRNISQAESRNSLIETSFANATDIMQAFKQRFIQVQNGTQSDSDLLALADLAKDSLEQMLDIANLKDETGGYIFSGYQIDVQPFSLQPDNSVVYQGDSGERQLQIAKSVNVPTNLSGDDAFMKAPNTIGDYSAVYNTNTSGIRVNRAEIVNPGLNNVTPGAGFPPDYNFNFVSATDLVVTDADGDVMTSIAGYTPGQIVSLPNGVEVQIDGNPLPGDNFDLTPQQNVSVFETMKQAIDWISQGNNPADPTQHKVDYDNILSQIDSALNQVVSNQTTAGIRLQLIENQENNHLDSELYLQKGRSNIEDLDYAKAIAEFEQSKVSLQAAQQTFVQVKNLSLFNYL
ncbi:flagellar hook-associated protein FlgL [Thalassotalea sp. 1_MG-2023]|uniref:flagellar hook-associated protein FlgL n=1 Tax=Thalassotalea sp. 1_MG-2023 TaxID=3062680 RepID=UPI0026E1EC50|nr:flagellar hook-associated protein FlgL [Thalassotalea sp. 1_MG-2023]MDO6426441.1 flagellar hook-associated protein FlgL [Thalassotalea sp. 1_MG-2023]